ncbi:MAG: RluA family pseudouridine synthase, partial [Clostridia bacterium]
MIKFRINKNDSGQKAERFLFKATTAPSSLIYKAFRKKDVKINGKWIKEGYILSEGEELSIYISDEFIREEKSSSAPSELDIVYEDKNIIVMNKPAGLRSQPDVVGQDALSERFRAYLIKSGSFDPTA